MTEYKEKSFETTWGFVNQDQLEKMSEPLTTKNCGEKLLLIRDVCGLTRKEFSDILGCSESTLSRIERNTAQPTTRFMNRLLALMAIGKAKYSQLSEQEKESMEEIFGTSQSISENYSKKNSTSILSAGAITTGLSAVTATSLASRTAIAASASILFPIAAGIAGVGLLKGLFDICESNNLSCDKVDEHFEIKPGKKKNNI